VCVREREPYPQKSPTYPQKRPTCTPYTINKYLPTKEPYIPTKEPYIPTKETHMYSTHYKYIDVRKRALYTHKRDPLVLHLLHIYIYPQKSPTYQQNSPTYPQKRPTYTPHNRLFHSNISESVRGFNRALQSAEKPLICKTVPQRRKSTQQIRKRWVLHTRSLAALPGSLATF